MIFFFLCVPIAVKSPHSSTSFHVMPHISRCIFLFPVPSSWCILFSVFSGALAVVCASLHPSQAILVTKDAFFTCSKFYKVACNILNKSPIPEAWHSMPFLNNWPQSTFSILSPTTPLRNTLFQQSKLF